MRFVAGFKLMLNFSLFFPVFTLISESPSSSVLTAQKTFPYWTSSPFRPHWSSSTAKNSMSHFLCLASLNDTFLMNLSAWNKRQDTAISFFWSLHHINWSLSRKRKWPNRNILSPCTQSRKGNSVSRCLWLYRKSLRCWTSFLDSSGFMTLLPLRKISQFIYAVLSCFHSRQWASCDWPNCFELHIFLTMSSYRSWCWSCG